MYDVIIIGAGPAGISAGIYAVSRGQKALILEKNQVGGLIRRVSAVTHYAAIVEGETGESFAKRLRKQAENAGVEILKTEVKKVELTGVEKKDLYRERMLLCEEGNFSEWYITKKTGDSGRNRTGRTRNRNECSKDAMKYRGKHVYVIGGADGAVKEALYLAGVAEKVTIIHFEETLGCIAQFQEKVAHTPNIELRLHARLHAVYGVEKVESLEILDEKTGAIETIEDPGCGIFVYVGTVPNTELYNEIRLDNGFLTTDENMQTEIPGVYAVGDIRVKQVRQVSTAVADGTIAAIHAAR